jgi:hypothetical protein
MHNISFFSVHYYGHTLSYMFRHFWVIVRETYVCISTATKWLKYTCAVNYHGLAF